jgi:hypothetical protein
MGDGFTTWLLCPVLLKTIRCQGSWWPNDSHRRPLTICRLIVARLCDAGDVSLLRKRSKPSPVRKPFRCRTRWVVLGGRVGTGDPPPTSAEAEQDMPVAYARSSSSSLPSSFFRSAATTQRTVSMSLTDSPSERQLTQGACNSIAASKVRLPFSVSTTSWARR